MMLTRFIFNTRYLWLMMALIMTCGIQQPAFGKNKEEPKKQFEIQYKVKGVDSEIEENIVAQLSIEEPEKSALNQETFQAFYLTTAEIAKKAIAPYGYFDAEVKTTMKSKQSVLAKQKVWEVSLQVTLGKPVTIKQVNLKLTGEGESNRTLLSFLHRFVIKKDQVLHAANYEKAKQALFDQANEVGFLDADFTTAEVIVDKEQHSANVTLVLDTGRQFYLGDVTFVQSGNHQLGKGYLQRFIPYYAGAVYSPSQLLKLQQDLLQTNDFQSVQIVANKEDAEQYIVPVTVKLLTRKRNSYTFGLGYGTDTQVRGTASWERRRLNKRGHHLYLSTKGSQLQQLFQVRYTVPGKHPATDAYNFNLGYQSSSVNTGDRDTQLVSIDYSKHYQKYWQRIIALTFVHETFQPKKDGIKEVERTKQLLMPSITYTKVRKDDLIKPKRGHRLRFDLRGALNELSSSTSFAQFHTQAKILGTPHRNVRWLARGEVGVTAVENFFDLPLSIRFEAGGPQSVRGYELESLGPGRYLMAFSIEHQQRIYRDFFLGAFFDMGNASNTFPPHLLKAVGPSLSWLSPIGTISISAAKPLDKSNKNDNKHWLFQFTLGPDI